MNVLKTIVNKFFPVESVEPEERWDFDMWRLPNDPSSPHVAAVRDLFIFYFRLKPEKFDAMLEPEEGIHRRLIVAARKDIICGGILYKMADNYGKRAEDQIDGGYISYIATAKNVRSHGAGRELLGLAHADFIVNGHSISRLIRLNPEHTAFFEAAGYQRTVGGYYGDMHCYLDLSPDSRERSQRMLNGLMTLY